MNDADRDVRAGENADNLAQAQYAAAGTIYGSNDPTAILDALIGFIGAAYEQAQLGLIDPDAHPATLEILASYAERRISLARQRVRLDTLPAYDTYSAIEVLNVANVEFDPFLDADEKAHLQNEDTRALLVIPMVVTQRLIGVVIFRSARPVSIGTARLRALRNLVDQAAVVFENQALLRDTESSLQEVRVLYEINRDMLSAVDVIDVLRVLRQKLAPEAATIFHISAVDDADVNQGYMLRYITATTGERDVQTPVAMLPIEIESGDRSGSSVTFAERSDQAVHPLHELAISRGAGAYAILNIRERGQLLDFIAITFTAAQEFDDRTRRLYTAVADQAAIVLQNQRLLIDAQSSAVRANQQLHTLQILNRLSMTIANLKDEDELLSYSVQAITESLNVDHGGVVLMSSDALYGTVEAEYPPIGMVGTVLPLTDNPLTELMMRDPNNPIVIEDMATDDRVNAETRQYLTTQAGIHGMVILPILLQEKLIGTIGLDMYTPGRKFDVEVIRTANTMAAQVGIALQNVRLLNDSRRRAEQLARVAAFGQSMQATLTDDAIFERLFAQAELMLPSDTMVLALFDAGRNQLRIQAQRRSITDTQPFSVSLSLETLPGMVYASGQTVYVPDIQTRTTLPPLPGIPLNTRSVLITPIMARGQALGIVMLTSEQNEMYSETDVALFEQLINQLAAALENSRAFRQSEKTARNEALINSISARLQQTTSPEDMIAITLREVGHALGARRGRSRFAPQPDPTPSMESSKE